MIVSADICDTRQLVTFFSMFNELTKEITKDLEAKESRQRARRDDAQANLLENPF
mgnify:CR=1 FL=1